MGQFLQAFGDAFFLARKGRNAVAGDGNQRLFFLGKKVLERAIAVKLLA